MIRVARVNGTGVEVESFDAESWSEQNGMLVLFRDKKGTNPLIAFASGVWLSVEVIHG